ncbi:putative lipoprotein [Burkholderia pseudomallei]|uniref:toxin-antitoxin system YwqK family antitoxin n=1 Tax=Burkholderia pseudomallei TaxID=28450 RepID=UPI0005315DB0|nr:hypothetical protein [Burkholderia pseudomallei]KGS91813.1 putative lipoprotein [Burkholderia pseudomallei MSHR7498]KGX22000.1 putative lipoprotein [Burkholderia pseudomallei]KGX28438.1 putative lipoprotein [Burkholderia pseudomallei]
MKSRLDPGFSKHALGITIVVMLAACGNKVLDYRNAQITNGKVYAGNADEPFSGKVTNVPFNAVFLNQPGYKKLIGPTNALIMGLYGTSLLCEIEVDDGALNGDVSCKKQQSEVVQVKAHFKGGALVDDFAMYDQSGKNPTLEASFKEGQPDGEINAYSPDTGKLVSQQTLKNGLNEGKFKQWDPKTGNLILESNYKNGILNGEFITYDADSNVLGKGTYSNGKFTGTGKLTLGHYAGAAYQTSIDVQTVEGVIQNQGEIDNEKKFVDEVNRCADRIKGETYDRTRAFPTKKELPSIVEQCKQSVSSGTPTLSPTSGEGAKSKDVTQVACVKRWTDAYMRDPMNAGVTNAQIQQWEGFCSQGKEPS